MQLNQIEHLPEELIHISTEELYTLFPEPTLLHLEGKETAPLFISILQHGNESTGLLAIQKILQKYQKFPLPRSISIFFGNTQAARYGKRVLDSQPDYNRVWPGNILPTHPETTIMREIVDEMVKRDVFASIDVHNNSGLNPHYACINKLENKFLNLASLFSNTVVYFLTPKGVQSLAFCEHCPSVTLECGLPESDFGTQHAFDYIDSIIHLSDISTKLHSTNSFKLFHTVARVHIPSQYSFSYTNSNADIFLRKELETSNFSEIPAGTCFAQVRPNSKARLFALNDDQEEVGNNFFHVINQQILTTKPIMPAMLTLDESIVRQDCLCYLMEPLQLKLRV